MIHVMPTVRLGGTAMSTPVVGNDAIALLDEEHHLRVPIIGGQRPAVAKHDRLTTAPILVVNLSTVYRSESRHSDFYSDFRCERRFGFYALGSLFDESCVSTRLRYVDRVARFDLCNLSSSSFGHESLRVRRDHPVLSSN